MLDFISIRFTKFARVFLVSAIVLLPVFGAAQKTNIDSLLGVLKGAKTDAQKSEIYNSLSQAAFSNNYRKSLEYAQQAVYFAKKTSDHRLLMSAYKNIASVFVTMGILDQAVVFFNLSAEEATKAGDKAEQLKNQLNLGLVFMGLGDYKKALSIYAQSDSLLSNVYTNVGEALPLADQITIQLNLGLCYSSLGDLSKGYIHFDKGISLTDSAATQPLLKARLLLSKANALLKENNLSIAFTTLKQAESILEELQDKPLLIVTQSLLSSIEERKSNYSQAVKIYNQLYQDATHMGSVKMMKEFSQSLYKNYERIQESDSAIKYLTLFNKYEKEAKSEEAKEVLIRKELMQEFSAREQMLVEKQASLSKRMVYIFVGGAFLLAILLGWILIYRKRYKQADLQKFKLQLEAERLELEQKQLLARVSHQDKQLADLEYKLSKNAMLENLVDELQTLHHDEKEQKNAETKTGEAPKGSHQGKIWDEFEIRFLNTHAGFFDRLMATYPGLTVNERRLCAFLRLDMTTKEISVITGQSIRAIEIARTRLRKKLNLTETEKTLFEHLSSF